MDKFLWIFSQKILKYISSARELLVLHHELQLFLICGFRELFIHKAILFIHEVTTIDTVMTTDTTIDKP
jgi:hypothetical protein